MKQMRDIDELFGALTEASAWRKKELNKLVSKFNFQYRKTTQKDPNNPEKTIVRYQYIEDDSSGRVVPLSALDKRAMYILTYSHWEGYVKQAIQIYLKSLGYVSFREAQSHPRAVRRILRTRLEEHKKAMENSDLSPEELQKLRARFIEQLDDDRLELQEQEIKIFSNTSSNLRIKVLKKLLRDLDIRIPEFFHRNGETIDKMVEIRNGIAHGDPTYRSDSFPEEVQDGLPKTIDFVEESFSELQKILIEKADSSFTVEKRLA